MPRFRIETLVAKIKDGEINAALSYLRGFLGHLPPDKIYPVAWKILRAWSALESMFGRGTIPDARSVAALEAFLANLAVELIVLARRGIIDEETALEAAKLIVGDEIVSLLRGCRRGECRPKEIMLHARVLKLAGEALASLAAETGDCIPA